MPDRHPLTRQKLFRDLQDQEIDALARQMRERHFRAGEVLVRKGDPPDDVYFVESGLVEVVLEGATHDQELARLGPGECVGEMSAIDRAPRSATVVALEDTHAFSMSTDDFNRYLQSSPRVCYALLRLLSSRLRRMVVADEAELLLSEIRPRVSERHGAESPPDSASSGAG